MNEQAHITLNVELGERSYPIEIGAGLLDLEKTSAPDAQGKTVETVFRAAHSLKGAARAVDFTEIESLCQSLGCEVPLPTQRQLIRTEWSELSFVPQHEHLIQLDATLKNLAPYPQAFPLMEVSLKDGWWAVAISISATRPQ